MVSLLGHSFGAEGVGRYFLYLSWASVLSAILSLGYPTYVLQAVPRLDLLGYTRQERRLLAKASLHILGAGLVAASMVNIVASSLAEPLLGDSRDAILLRYAVFGAISLGLLRLGTDALRAKGRPTWALILEFNFAVAAVVLVLGTARLVSSPSDVVPFILAHAVAMSMGVLVAFALLLREWRRGASVDGVQPLPEGDRGKLRSFWGLGLLVVAFPFLPLMILPQFASIADVGSFAIAQRIVAVATVLLVGLSSIF
jgi:O-antigen/teichoic acid export membrane protein